ncbi:MAG TPA: cation diffusion facilitator family transporter [Anaerolineae bacterium]|nr:cation diffusion facilitator family transporter [Anaerolineae bacterium]
MSITRRVALLSVSAAIVTLLLKFGAYALTGSVGLLSDAIESFVNLAAALIAFTAISIAHRPPDDNHAYGHDKAEYFSSGAEGALILIAAGVIIVSAANRLLHPAPLDNLGIGSVIALAASAINFGVSRILLRVAHQEDSIALEADAQHLMTDVWTSIGVVAGILVAGVTGWQMLDPLIAIAVGLNIVWMGVQLLRRSTAGLMDVALPGAEVAVIQAAISGVVGPDVPYHALRTRKSGSRRFIDFHLLLPGKTTVQTSHDLISQIEAAIEQELPKTYVTIHVEPSEDAASWDGHIVGGLASAGPAPAPPESTAP